MTDVKLSPDGSTITVFVPIAWRRRGGRKVIVAPPGCEDWAPPPRIDGVLRLTLLAPDIVERILDGRPTAGLAEFLRPFPVEWERQRERFSEQ